MFGDIECDRYWLDQKPDHSLDVYGEPEFRAWMVEVDRIIDNVVRDAMARFLIWYVTDAYKVAYRAGLTPMQAVWAPNGMVDILLDHV